MIQWEEEKEQFIKKLETTAGAFECILDKDANGMVIKDEDRNNLKDLLKSNKRVLNKLKNKEFAVAVVGLEKAGKSTVANALINLIVLPDDPARCTYTTTQICAGEKDMAQVFFYTYAEFNCNFKKMLQQIEYPNITDFGGIAIEAFENWWNAMETKNPEAYQLYNGTIVEDIKSIIKGKGIIEKYLGKKTQDYYGKNELSSTEFKSFITGVTAYDENNKPKAREPRPYAVKNVIIHSTGLNEMQNIVLYDVPGFDSPTQLHKDQTLKNLKEADAIILVTNVGDRPNLVGTQLDMLRKGHDDDGIKLSEKTFVFGNKLDCAADAGVAKYNMGVLREDAVEKYKITTTPRFICGSAKAYIENKNLQMEDEKLRQSSKEAESILLNWELPNGIDDLRNATNEYYHNDRFEVLKKRAESIIRKIEVDFQDILQRYTPEKLTARSNVGFEHVLDAKNALKKFSKEAGEIEAKYQKDIAANKPFSKDLLDNLDRIYPLINANDEIVESVAKHTSFDSDGIFRLEQFTVNLRKQLERKCREDLLKQTAQMTEKIEQEIMQELVDTFLTVMGVQDDSPDKQELIESSEALFKHMLVQTGGGRCYFNPLIERFSTSIIETLIGCSFGRQERLEKIIKSLDEFLALASYYKEDGVEKDYSLPLCESVFFQMILAHKDIQKNAAANEQTLKDYFIKNSELMHKAGFLALEIIPFGKWAKIIAKAGMTLSDGMPPGLKKEIEKKAYNVDWQERPPGEKIESLTELVTGFCDHIEKKSGDAADYLTAIHKQAQVAQTKEEAISEINTDIKILKLIMGNSIIRALDLERALLSIVIKNIELIRGKSDSDEPIGEKSALDEWISSNIRKIKNNEFAAIDNENTNNYTRSLIIDEIKKALDKIEA